MEENNKNGEFKVEVDKEELKNQTKDTVNQVKETVKNIDFKKDASATKGFILELISKPFSTIEAVVTEKENRFSNAVILMICFMAVSFMEYFIGTICYEYSSFKFLPATLAIVSPVLFVLAFTVAVFLFGGKEKKSITTILSGIAISTTPLIASYLLSIVYDVCVGKLDITVIGYITSILRSTLNFVFITLMFISIKNLITKEDDDIVFRKVAVIILVGYAILKVLSILNLYSIV